MTAQITRQAHNSITIEVTLPLTGSMLRAEEAIQDALNEVGLLATEKNLERFDTDGSPIQLGSVRMTSKGQFAQDYETPYGSVSVLRHVYQSSEGGKTFCPLEESDRLVLNTVLQLREAGLVAPPFRTNVPDRSRPRTERRTGQRPWQRMNWVGRWPKKAESWCRSGGRGRSGLGAWRGMGRPKGPPGGHWRAPKGGIAAATSVRCRRAVGPACGGEPETVGRQPH